MSKKSEKRYEREKERGETDRIFTAYTEVILQFANDRTELDG